MKKKKLKLTELKVNSFVTQLKPNDSPTINGGQKITPSAVVIGGIALADWIMSAISVSAVAKIIDNATDSEDLIFCSHVGPLCEQTKSIADSCPQYCGSIHNPPCSGPQC